MVSKISRRIYMVAFVLIIGVTLNVGTADALLSSSQYNALRDQFRLGSGTAITAPTPTTPATPTTPTTPSTPTTPEPASPSTPTAPTAPTTPSTPSTPDIGQSAPNNSRADYYSRFNDNRGNFFTYPGNTGGTGTIPTPAPAPTPTPAPAPAPNPTPTPTPNPTPAPAPAPTTPPVSNPGDVGVGEKQMLDLVNQERIKAGLPAFKVDSRLVTLARQKSQDMYQNNYFSHTSPTYGSAYDMEKKAGISARVMGAENIAKAATVTRAHDLLMNSAGHRANILDSRHDTIGIGIVSTPGGVYVTQLFLGN